LNYILFYLSEQLSGVALACQTKEALLACS